MCWAFTIWPDLLLTAGFPPPRPALVPPHLRAFAQAAPLPNRQPLSKCQISLPPKACLLTS